MGDIAWDKAFAPCVSRTAENTCRIDFAAFAHDLVDARDAAPPASDS